MSNQIITGDCEVIKEKFVPVDGQNAFQQIGDNQVGSVILKKMPDNQSWKIYSQLRDWNISDFAFDLVQASISLGTFSADSYDPENDDDWDLLCELKKSELSSGKQVVECHVREIPGKSEPVANVLIRNLRSHIAITIAFPLKENNSNIKEWCHLLDLDELCYSDLRATYQRNENLLTGTVRTIKEAPSSEGCYIATCVYGSYDCPEVWTLRRFRDSVLYHNTLGRCFIRMYYAVSPQIVKHFGKNQSFKTFWKSGLDRLIYQLNRRGIEDTPYDDR